MFAIQKDNSLTDVLFNWKTNLNLIKRYVYQIFIVQFIVTLNTLTRSIY